MTNNTVNKTATANTITPSPPITATITNNNILQQKTKTKRRIIGIKKHNNS
jgi:hypothetical protein